MVVIGGGDWGRGLYRQLPGDDVKLKRQTRKALLVL